MFNRWCCVLALLGSLVIFKTARASPPDTPVAVVTLRGEVDDYQFKTLSRQFAEARKAGAKTIVLDIDTYGGMVVSGLDITHFIRAQTDLHVIAYVDKAVSAGAMIAVACDEIVMAPSGIIGDCAPIVFKSDHTLDELPAAERAKQESPILNDFDASADHAHYSRLLLESMVAVEKVVYYVQDPRAKEKRFVDQAEYEKLIAKGWVAVTDVPCPVDGPNTLLTVQTDEAVKLGLATGISPSAAALAEQRGRLVADLTPGAGEVIVEFLNMDIVRSLLITILMGSLYVVLGSPGHGLAEACAVISLALLLGVPLLTGYASWWEVAAIFGGLALLAFEVFVFPGHGVSAIAGIVLFLVGLVFTFVGPQTGGGILPNNPSSWANLRHGALSVTGGMVASIALWVWLRSYLPKLPYFNKLILTTTSGNQPIQNSAEIPPENSWPGVGTAGTAVTDLRPGGSAEFLDLSIGNPRPIAVISETGYVTAGARLIVQESRGSRVVVRPAQV